MTIINFDEKFAVRIMPLLNYPELKINLKSLGEDDNQPVRNLKCIVVTKYERELAPLFVNCLSNSQSCVKRLLGMLFSLFFVDQRMQCWGSWNEKKYKFVILSTEGRPPQYILVHTLLY